MDKGEGLDEGQGLPRSVLSWSKSPWRKAAAQKGGDDLADQHRARLAETGRDGKRLLVGLRSSAGQSTGFLNRIGRRAGKPRGGSAQSRGKRRAARGLTPIPSQARPPGREGVETRRAAPKGASRILGAYGEGIVQTTNASRRRRKPKWYETWGRRFEPCRGRHALSSSRPSLRHPIETGCSLGAGRATDRCQRTMDPHPIRSGPFSSGGGAAPVEHGHAPACLSGNRDLFVSRRKTAPDRRVSLGSGRSPAKTRPPLAGTGTPAARFQDSSGFPHPSRQSARGGPNPPAGVLPSSSVTGICDPRVPVSPPPASYGLHRFRP